MWIFMSLISSASHRKLMSLIRISSLSTHTSHHPINHNQRTTHRVQDTVAHSHSGSKASSLVMCQVSFYKIRCWMCTGICGSASLAFKGTMKVKRFVLIKLMLTLNGLNVSASCVKEGAGKKKMILSQSNERLNLRS